MSNLKSLDPGELVPTSLRRLDAVSSGRCRLFTQRQVIGSKITVVSFFRRQPSAQKLANSLAWMLYDDGLMSYSSACRPLTKVLPCGIIAPETSGWFKEEQPVADPKALTCASVLARRGNAWRFDIASSCCW
jgi:hypothetical protein